MTGKWVEPDLRDTIVDFIRDKKVLTGLNEKFFRKILALEGSKFTDWKKRYGKVNCHNGQIPRDHWIEKWERQAIIDFYSENVLDGYRRCTYMMMDQDIVYVSPATVYRVLKKAGVMRTFEKKPSLKGTGFNQPKAPHKHWHTDISYVSIGGTLYFLMCVLDGYSRYIVHWDLRESMKQEDVNIVIQAAKEKYPDAKPRIISDNGAQYKSKDFKTLLNQHNMTHVTTSPYYPQSNGKLERFHKSIKEECIRLQCPLTIESAMRIVGKYVVFYNEERLHSAVGYISPKDVMEGRADEIHQKRERSLENRRQERKESNRKLKQKNSVLTQKRTNTSNGESQESRRISAEGCSVA